MQFPFDGVISCFSSERLSGLRAEAKSALITWKETNPIPEGLAAEIFIVEKGEERRKEKEKRLMNSPTSVLSKASCDGCDGSSLFFFFFFKQSS